ncbi:MAG: hypothetical protein P4L92_18750 [Rudaea sp.]|nr:hypothetical protein [Rudaea sp.]
MHQVHGVHGRDAGKTFWCVEIDPLALSGYVLRLVSALRVESYEALLAQITGAQGENGVPLDAIMQMLQGADPRAIHALLSELLDYVLITPDPKHPGVKRALVENEIREIRTLGDVLMGIAKLNFRFGE